MGRLASTALGETLTVGDVGLTLAPPAVWVRGVGIRHVSEAGEDQEVLRLDEARVTLVWHDGRPALGELVLTGPRVVLRFDEAGQLVPFRHVARPDAEAPRAPLTELPFASARIEDGELVVEHPQLRVHLRDLDVLPSVDGGTIGASASIDRGDLRVDATLRGAGVRMGRGGVSVDALQLDAPPLTVWAQGQWAMPDGFTADVEAALDLAGLTPLLPAPRDQRALYGHVGLAAHAEGTPAAPRFRAAAAVVGLGFDAPGIGRTVHDRFGDLSVRAEGDRAGAELTDLEMRWADGLISGGGHITFASMNLDEARLHAEGLSLRRLLQQVDAAPTPWVDFRGDADISAHGPLAPLALEGAFDIRLRDYVVGDGPVQAPRTQPVLHVPRAHLRGELELQPRAIHLGVDRFEATGRGDGLRGSVHADIGFGPLGPLDLTFDLPDADLEGLAPLGGAGLDGHGRVQGHLFGPFNHLQAEGSASIDQFRAVGLSWADHMDAALSSPDMKRIALREVVAHRGASTYTGDLDLGFVGGMTLRAEIDTEHARAADLIGVAVDLPGVDGDVSGHIDLAGPFQRLQGEVDLRFDAAHIAGEHLDGGEAHARMVDGELWIDRLRLTREAGAEGLDVRGRVGLGYALDLDVVADGLRLESLDNLRAWLPPQPDLRDATWSGAVAAWARVGGTLQSPAPHGRVWVTDVRWQGTDLADSLIDFSTTEGDLHFHAELLGGDVASYGTLDLVEDHHLELTAVVDDLRLGQLAVEAADGGIVDGTLSGALQLQGDVGPGQAGLTDLHGRVDELTLSWGGHTLTNPAPWVADFHEGRVVVDDFALQGGGTAIAFDLATGPTDLDLRGGGKLDLALLRAVVPGLTRAEGVAAIDVVAATPPQGGPPRTTITAAVEGGLIEHGSVPLLLEDLSARLHADRDGVRVEALHASAGGGTLDVEGGVRSDGWTPERFDLHAAVQGAEVQWIPELPPAIGDAQISLTGPVGALLLRGDIDVRSMEFTERIDWEDSVVAFRGDVATDGTRPGVERWFDIDLGIHAPGTLRFDNNLAEGIGSAELRVVGDTSRPGLVGAARIDSGDAFLQDHRFEIQRGLVEFLDPWSWDPELDIHLETSVPTRNRTYDVRYDIQGPYSAWQVEASSDAGLSPGDVNALLWFGATPDELAAQGDPQAVAGALAGDLAQLLLADLFASTGASELRDNLAIVDRVEFITGIDARGDWSFDPQVQISKRFRRFGDVELLGEFNLVRSDDQLFRLQRRFGAAWTLGVWYATLDRRTILPTSVDGAFGLDVTLHWESR